MGKDKQKCLFLILCLGIRANFYAACELKVHDIRTCWEPYACKHRDAFICSFVKDMGLIVKNIFDWDSYKIAIASFPFVVAGRMIDDKLQCHFYDRHHHKNIHQLPDWTQKAADLCIYVPVATLSSLLIAAPTHDMRTAGRAFVAGLPFVWLGKDVIKQCKVDINLRPWNEHFSRYHRSYGGFPSGHMAASMYMTLFWGLRYGPKCAIPLGLLSVGIGVTYLTGNRHYLSQLIGGAAWGALWAYAARKVVDHDLKKDYQFNLGLNAQGNVELGVSYKF
jgi:membrane-associated phospholipid phosphatase